MYALTDNDRDIPFLGDHAHFAIIEAYGDFKAIPPARLILDGIARECAQNGATDDRQRAAIAATDRVARHAAKGAACDHSGTCRRVVLDDDGAHACDSANANDLLALGLAIGIDV